MMRSPDRLHHAWIGDEHSGPHYRCQPGSGFDQSGFDDFETSSCLRIGVGVDGAVGPDGCRSCDRYQIPNSHRPGEPNRRLER